MYETSLIVSPTSTRTRVIELINAQRDIGSSGRIAIKVNGLTDPAIIDALYEASAPGVEIRLEVPYALLPASGRERTLREHHGAQSGGRFLEHSRVFIFRTSGLRVLFSVHWFAD